MVTLTQKEQMLIKDLRSHEDWCVRKYSYSAEMAQDPALKQMFNEIGEHERQNLSAIDQILSGQIPSATPTQTVRSATNVGTGVGTNVGVGSQYSTQSQQQTMQFSGSQSGRHQVEFAAQNPNYQASSNQNFQTTTQNQGYQATSQKPFPFSRRAQEQYSQETGKVGNQVNQNVRTNTGTSTRNTDVELCMDLLNAEKFISSNYNTVIFECNDYNLRDTLNRIQTDEQHHGFLVWEYLKSHGGYNS